MDTDLVLINFLLYVLLPLWGIAGFVDWCCHRATHIESTSGIKESLMHSMMGIQIAIPILCCLLFEVNVLILLICLAALICHELIAHWDVHFAAPRREISIWEVHAHNYLATLPLYMFFLIVVINWPVLVKLLSFQWQDEISLVPLVDARYGDNYLLIYLLFMSIICVFPYFEENLRCLKYYLKVRRQAA